MFRFLFFIGHFFRKGLAIMENIERIAIFASHGGSLPDGCPNELGTSDFRSRKALAEWLLEHCQNFITEEHDGISVFEYMFHDSWFSGPACLAVVPIDISRPWLLHWYDGKERIWYLDQTDENSQVQPDVQPKLVAHGFTGDSCVIK